MHNEYDTYEGFAERYDLFFGEFSKHPPVIIDFFKQLFDENHVNSVLDCACGTGRDIYLFNSLGCEVYGSDISEAMLNQTRKNLSILNLELPLSRVDYRKLPDFFDERFDAVTCLGGSISEMPNESEALRAFESMCQVLGEDGILVIAQARTDKQWKEKPRFIPMVNTKDFSRICVIDYFEKGARYNILDILHSEENDDFNVWSIDYLHILLRDDFDRLLKSAGFKEINFYGNYYFDPYDKDTSNNLVVVAKK
ncbi:class I SAM-dependent methyltransferase [Chloroflexota bacterium]